MLPEIGYDVRPATHAPILADLGTGLGKMFVSENPKTDESSNNLFPRFASDSRRQS